MRVRINSISLLGAERRYDFQPGLNIITGPITTGKTTLLHCLIGLLRSKIGTFPREAREVISNLGGQILVDDSIYEIVRPFVTTATAKVDIAGDHEAWRLPSSRSELPGESTYGQWLMEKMNLQRIDVPTAPTQPESDTSPISINDYMMYCHLRQEEIDSSVFGHTNFAKNNKRKFVFEIVYGKYDSKISSLQEARREAYTELRRLSNQTKNLEEFLAGTPFENRATIERELHETEGALKKIEAEAHESANFAATEYDTKSLSEELREIDSQIEDLQRRLEHENNAEKEKKQLMAQLQTQSIRITRSIVAQNYLSDFDFIICPRCGSSVSIDRVNGENCYLCLQPTTPMVSRKDLIGEQERLEKQIIETRELISMHSESAGELEAQIKEIEHNRNRVTAEIDFRTRTYISDKAESIAKNERRRTELKEKYKRLSEYLQLYARQDISTQRITELESRIQDLDTELDAAINATSVFDERVRYLEEVFREGLKRIKAPRFPNPGPTGIDRQTYMPILDGRRFDELQSPGLQVIVNIAHALAHQMTALHFDLTLPNILFIDGLSGNLGYKDLDLMRIEAIYDYIIDIVSRHHDDLQIIVADNTVPQNGAEFIKVTLKDDDKLIPSRLIESVE